MELASAEMLAAVRAFFMLSAFRPGSLGDPFSGPLYEEEVRVGHWGGIGFGMGLNRQRVMTEVYPLNYLTGVHLEKEIKGMPLSTWIISNVKHGQLQPVTDAIWLWTVDESDIPEVRDQISDAGLIFVPESYF